MGCLKESRSIFGDGSGRTFFKPPPPSPFPSASERARIGRLFSRVRYRNWRFCLDAVGLTFNLTAYRSDPASPSRLQWLGPFPPLPEYPDAEQVEAAALAAVVATDGESARDEFSYLEE